VTSWPDVVVPGAEARRWRVSRTPVIVLIIATTALVAVFDLETSAALVGSILFIGPLALCAMQRSKWVLWSTALTVATLTLAIGQWGPSRTELHDAWAVLANRGLLVVSMVTLASFIHLWLNKRAQIVLDAAQILRHRNELAVQHGQLELLVQAATHEVTVREAAAQHLAQMEVRYRGLLEAAPDAMVVVNEGGEIVLLNLRAEHEFGYQRDELVGQAVTVLIPEGFAERLISDETRSAAEALAQQIGTGIELSGRRKDGTTFPIELMLSPLDSPNGILVTAAIRDISVRKAAEHHLAQMESRYRGLLEAAPDAMALVSMTGVIVLVNVETERHFGYRRDELVGQLLKTIIPDTSTILPEVRQRILGAIASNQEAVGDELGGATELRGLRKDGSEFSIEIAMSVLHGIEGPLVTVAIRDVTARKKADDQLRQTVAELHRSNEELGQFAYIASHDLQEPLRMIASYTQLLSRRYKGKLDADADEFIAFAVDGANRMQRLIQDLLSYSRVGTAGKVLADTSSEHALEQAIANLQTAIEDSGALVTHDPLPDVRADEGQLVQLFQNLVGNAIKYQRPGVPQIHISSARATSGAPKWTFSVRDNGLGIDAKYFERIFGMFQRLHKREEFAGTGIGLAICKKIVERHGGSISVESQPGRGSTFRFALTGSEQPS
jgi:PAS domain S-box-containing protein